MRALKTCPRHFSAFLKTIGLEIKDSSLEELGVKVVDCSKCPLRDPDGVCRMKETKGECECH